jgi:hypothetical protein
LAHAANRSLHVAGPFSASTPAAVSMSLFQKRTFAWSSVGQQYNFNGHLALKDDWTAPDIDTDGYRQL